MTKTLRKLFIKYRQRCYLDIHNLNSVFLAGSGRSGTTWVEDIINHNNSYRIMFEPFHVEKNPTLKGWSLRQYIDPQDKDKNIQSIIEQNLSGNIRNDWIDRFNKKLFAKKRLIKDIRANLFLKWINNNFPTIPIIFLMRHPCAVTHSRMKIGWLDHLDEYLSQNKLIADYLSPFIDQICNAKDPFERNIYMWCIENYIPLKQFKKGEILVLFYENICSFPERETERIFSYLNNELDKKKMALSIQKPSSVCHHDSAIFSGKNLTSSWRNKITNEQLTRAIEICSLFGLDQIYAYDNHPLVDENDVLELIYP